MNIKNMASSPGCSSRVWPLSKSENLLCGSPCQGSVRTWLRALAAASGCPVLCLCLLPANTVLGLLPFESFPPPWILHMTQMGKPSFAWEAHTVNMLKTHLRVRICAYLCIHKLDFSSVLLISFSFRYLLKLYSDRQVFLSLAGYMPVCIL